MVIYLRYVYFDIDFPEERADKWDVYSNSIHVLDQ